MISANMLLKYNSYVGSKIIKNEIFNCKLFKNGNEVRGTSIRILTRKTWGFPQFFTIIKLAIPPILLLLIYKASAKTQDFYFCKLKTIPIFYPFPCNII